ncbi:MAG TPA: dihydrolipoamide acetyltransferase family protein [Candidatus Binatia bacterium]|jgi:pyruvate dehydrogenase E2 component (dihydrolipoamide acetyltransferase)
MKVEVRMPRLSDSMSEGSVTAWFKSEGEAVAEGEAIAEIETEKSTVDLQAPKAGVLARIVVAAGSGAVAVDSVLAEIETDAQAAAQSKPIGEASADAPHEVEQKGGENAQAQGGKDAEEAKDTTAANTAPPREKEAAASREQQAPAPSQQQAPAPSQPQAPAPSQRQAPAPSEREAAKPERPARGDEKKVEPRKPPLLHVARPAREAASGDDDAEIAATPLARRMAAQAGIPLASLSASGIGGKICKADVEAAVGRTSPLALVSSRPAAPGATPTRAAAAPAPMSRVRKTIAERMTRSKATIPHFYLSSDCRVDRLLDVRERLKADGLSISVNDFVVRAAAIALGRVPEANASWSDDGGIIRHDRIDIAVAVALDDGMVTPVVRGADGLGLAAIGETIRALAARARDGKLAPSEYDGATFTISNLGMHGVGEMFAIINPPQACILGVGAAEPRAVVENGNVVAGTVMTLSVSADHRVLDGTTGARLLAEIRRLLEEPARMLV